MPIQSTALTCPLCSHGWTATWEQSHISACPGCGVPTTVPPPSRDIASDGLFTEGAYGGQRLAKREQWLLEARKRLEWIQQHVSGGRLLEVGSATGEFVSVAEGSGFDVVGLETSTWAATASRDITQRVVCADPEDWLPSQEGQFDAVAAFHTLEHVHDPSAFLSALSRALRPGGLVFLEVPNGAARDMRDGERWLGARLPDHVLHYRPEDLRRLCGSTELAVRELSPLTMREFDSSLVWLLRRGRWLARGRLAASEDFLRLVAVKA